ncbi:hypothetical protein ACSTS3_19175 [Aquimarina muelleri]|uniref:hypothetical protein n=1 Tax=Aquimarina muelleri TaxID=279356 RepID=UPI003F685D02
MVADVIATQEAHKIMNDVREYNKLLLENAKIQGLSKLRLFLDTTRTNKLIGFRLIENIPHKTHCKVMSGQIKVFSELEQSIREESSDKYYAYLLQVIDNPDTERITYIIDSAYDY